MPKKIAIVLLVFLSAVLLKTFYFNRPDLKQETVVSSYLEKEQSGRRADAENFLSTDLKYVKILEKSYEKLKKEEYKNKDTQREFELKESKREAGYVKIILIEKVAGETYFFDFLLSPTYQPEGKTEFEIYLAKEGNWWSGYQWKIAKIDSSTLIQYAKLGEEKEIKTNVFAVPLEIANCQFSDQKCLLVSIRNEALHLSLKVKGETESENWLSYSDWKIVDISQKEYASPSIKIFILNKEQKIEENIPFFLPEKFALKEVLFKNEGREIHFLPK